MTFLEHCSSSKTVPDFVWLCGGREGEEGREEEAVDCAAFLHACCFKTGGRVLAEHDMGTGQHGCLWAFLPSLNLLQSPDLPTLQTHSSFQLTWRQSFTPKALMGAFSLPDVQKIPPAMMTGQAPSPVDSKLIISTLCNSTTFLTFTALLLCMCAFRISNTLPSHHTAPIPILLP